MSELQDIHIRPPVRSVIPLMVVVYGIFQIVLLLQCAIPSENLSATKSSGDRISETSDHNNRFTELSGQIGGRGKALFNGIDLTGWEPVDTDLSSWNVEDSILFTTGEGGGWLSTEKMYDDFILSLEFRLPEGGNSGVFLRAPREGDPAYTGMEVQILDDYAEEYENLKPWQYSGSVYNVQAPSKQVLNPAGEWNKYEILCDGPVVKVWLNGQLINDVNLNQHMDKSDTHPGINRRSGYIGLQNHSTRVDFRNIYLEVLD